jgi:hypothetical protein
MAIYVNPGLDASGNGNNWTTNNINWTGSGVTFDTMTDVPTLTSATAANYAVVNPLKSFSTGALTITNGNLSVSSTTNDSRQALGTIGFNTGKFYWESTILAEVSNFDFFIGLADETTASGNSTSGFGSYRGTGLIRNFAGTSQTAGNTYTVNDVIGVAVDADAGTIQFYKNGSAQGATPSFTFTANSLVYPSFFIDNNVGTRTLAANFGQRPFAYTPPTGFVALNTFNLPTPTIGATASTQAGKYFNAVTWTGTNTTGNRSITGVGFQPDFVWAKSRSAAYDHCLYDAVRGAGATKELISNSASIEGGGNQDQYGYLSSFDSDGFSSTVGSLGQNLYFNDTAFPAYVAWNWNAGGSTVTNTAGSISAQVRANTTAGFSIVTYTGNGAVGATVGHGLGVAPSMIILKRRTGSTASWLVWNRSLSNLNNNYLLLDSNSGQLSSTNIWGTQTSSVIALDTDSLVNEQNANGSTFVAYCFAPVAGYSAFGSYTGNGSADGPFIYTGFEPRYFLLKNISRNTTRWIVMDTARDPTNVAYKVLSPNDSNAEDASTSYWLLDFVSNGVKLRYGADTEFNNSGDTYIYMAFAQTPLKYSNAR